MILVMCDDDDRVWEQARLDAQANSAIFGVAYLFVTDTTPQLDASENLFISAHGTEGEMGNEDGPFGINGIQLFEYLTNSPEIPNGRGESLFPNDYVGDIYISVCSGADYEE